MAKSRHRKNQKRAKRPSYQPESRSDKARSLLSVATGSKSALGKEIWAMVGPDEKSIHFGCTYDEALSLAKKHGGTVMTDAAANRIHGFNELASQSAIGN
jgi:hypothetical protein